MNPNDFVKAYREGKNLTLKQASEQSGIDPADLSRIENGLRISDRCAIRLHKWTGASLDYFLGEASEPCQSCHTD